MSGYKKLRLQVEGIKKKLRSGESITASELEAIKQKAAMNSSTDNLTLYAVAKKHVEVAKLEENEHDTEEQHEE
ncbi:hypothetical protein [Mesobacillus selenatarsenatis]|uniref:Uncharacterized protein n=1 Tax=Mesobacillus selenatarsenatis (strain DSM 18680 / JCM 14380 / FERM P-15431 / SF-1) TaxID=1321606 RepID=A0A0A8WWW1_MESS1|nr:hypothetical protein [Mesobacillus selenatarsenatis]GAM12108.1 hypothetical protein SAMD00020551_0227 [Mesobacillus selenatarsenatis SF-1]